MDKLLYFPSIDKFGQRTSDVLFPESNSFEKCASENQYDEAIGKFLKTIKPEPEKYLYMLLHALGAGPTWGCFLEGAPVLLSNGYEKPIEEIEKDDKVITHTGNYHKVLEPLYRRYTGSIYKFRFNSWGEELQCTENHPIYGIKRQDLINARKTYYQQKISRDKFVSNLDYKFIDAKNLSEKDYICVPFPVEYKATPELGDINYAKLMGWYLAEGCLARNYEKPGLPWSRVVLVLGSHETEYIKDIKQACKNIGCRLYVKLQGSVARIEINHQPLVDACLKHVGRGSRGKFISSDILKMNDDWKKEFLSSYLSGDGCQTKRKGRYYGSVRSSTASRKVAAGLSKLSASLGYYSTFFKCKQHDTSISAGNIIYENSYQRDISKILDNHKFTSVSAKVKNSSIYIDKKRGYILVPIKEISHYDYDGIVYNLHVENDNSYVVNNFAVHNSNRNGDWFDEWALKYDGPEYGHKTFERMAKLYKHHVNKDPDKSYGDVLFSHYDDKMKRVLLIVSIDREKAPDICYRIEVDGDYPDVSMGCKVPYDICSICGNKAKSPKFYCDHARHEMNRIYPDGRKVFVKNPFPRFFDISQVFIGADPPSKFLHRIPKEDMGIQDISAMSEQPSTYGISGLEKSASVLYMPSALLAEKVGYTTKSSEMYKTIPAGEVGSDDESDKHQLVMYGMSKLRNSEPKIKKVVLKKLADYPLKEVLTTLTSLGISLDTDEFQKIALARLGEPKLAEVLDKKNIEFKITDDLMSVEPMNFSHEDFNHDVKKIAMPIMKDRSDLQPYLFDRSLKTLHSKDKISDSDFKSSRTNVAPGLATVAGLYLAYKKGLLKLLGPLDKAVERLSEMVGVKDLNNPAMIIPIAAATAATISGAQGLLREHGRPEAIADSDMLKLSSARNLALVSGLFAAPYVAREHVIQKAEEGERPGLAGRLLYKYPGIASAASVLTAPAIVDKATKLKRFLSDSTIGKMIKRGSVNTSNVSDWFLNSDSNQEWKDLLDNVVKNDFWSREKLAHNVSKHSMNVCTILALAALGSEEE